MTQTDPGTTPGALAGDPSPQEMARLSEVDPRITALLPGFDAPFFQAGLAGYSDAAMRLIARRHGCPYCITEAMLDRILLSGGKGLERADLEVLADNVPGGAEDHPLAGQIMGTEPGEMAQSAALLSEMGYDVIDVNLACPVRKIARKCRGGHFLAHPADALEVLRAVREAVPHSIPTTLKLRRGSDDSPEAALNFERIFDGAYELGYAWATVHGRTVEQKYIGPSRWEFLRDLVSRYPDRLIFGSGDIWEAMDIFRMRRFTGVHAVSVARGCIGNPWIFTQARQIAAGTTPTAPTIAQQREALRQHFDLCCAVNGEKQAGRLMRKFGIKFSRHHPREEEVKMAFVRVTTLAEWHAVLDAFYGESPDDGSAEIAVGGAVGAFRS